MILLLLGGTSCEYGYELDDTISTPEAITLLGSDANDDAFPFPPDYLEKNIDCKVFLSEQDMSFIEGDFISMSLDETGSMYIYSPKQEQIFVFF